MTDTASLPLPKALITELRLLMAEVMARDWPAYEQNPDLCMQRAREYLDGSALLCAKYGVTR